jgi:hypothetical protein
MEGKPDGWRTRPEPALLTPSRIRWVRFELTPNNFTGFPALEVMMGEQADCGACCCGQSTAS